jgi:hypothetical protein
MTASGRCLCGAVEYRVKGPLRDVLYCHCKRCRRTHSHVAAYSECARGDLELVQDRGLRWYEIDGARYGFCGECGASLFWSREERPTISFAAGSLDEPTGLHATCHIFTDFAGDYYEIADGLEQRPAY